MVAAPDKVEVLLPTHCQCCGNSLESVDSIKEEKRQLFDLPKIEMKVTEHQAHTKECPHCHTQTKATFLEDINATTQYGANLKSFISYLNAYQMLPYERIAQLVEDFTHRYYL